MAPMNWTQAELDALRRAYASGTLRVTYEGKTIEYGSAADLLSRIRTIERDRQAAGNGKSAIAGLAGYSRGDR